MNQVFEVKFPTQRDRLPEGKHAHPLKFCPDLARLKDDDASKPWDKIILQTLKESLFVVGNTIDEPEVSIEAIDDAFPIFKEEIADLRCSDDDRPSRQWEPGPRRQEFLGEIDEMLAVDGDIAEGNVHRTLREHGGRRRSTENFNPASRRAR